MAHHRLVEEWMGERIETLADLLRPGLTAVCIGFNPSPTSVRAGHYYQGPSGQQFLGRLQHVGLLPSHFEGWEDDVAFGQGVGFTDIVKRPSYRASDIPSEEYAHGRPLLTAKLEEVAPRLVIFSFERAAPRYFGEEVGVGFLDDRPVAGAEVFVAPWKETRENRRHLDELRQWVANR